MFNKPLQYMMRNNPEETLSQKGSAIRAKIRPTFINILKLANKLNLVIEKKEFQKGSRPVIYVASHGFKDDVLNTIVTLKANAYVVFGNIDLFFHTLDGICLWIYGTQLVDRYDKTSKHAMKDKMNKIMELGNDIIIFSEATWNLSPNKPMERLHWGFYDVAEKNNALIVPVLTQKVGKNCYARVLPALDLKKWSREDIKEIYGKMKKYADKAEDILLYKDLETNSVKEIIKSLKQALAFLNHCDSIEEASAYIDTLQEEAQTVSTRILSFASKKHELELDSFHLAAQYIKRISTIKKEIFSLKLRDIMALEKVDMFAKHPDYSYMASGKDMYEAWEDFLKDTIAATPYFYPELEATTLCKDPFVQDADEVMPVLKIKK